jgi:hypothetical protein
MKDFLVMSGVGLIVFVLGIVLLKREKRLIGNPAAAKATVVTYYDYTSTSAIDDIPGRRTLYTMAVEYTLPDGRLIHALEQKGSPQQKYAVGTVLEIEYSPEKPDFFIIKGDWSRKAILIGMIIVGILMITCGIFILKQQG